MIMYYGIKVFAALVMMIALVFAVYVTWDIWTTLSYRAWVDTQRFPPRGSVERRKVKRILSW